MLEDEAIVVIFEEEVLNQRDDSRSCRGCKVSVVVEELAERLQKQAHDRALSFVDHRQNSFEENLELRDHESFSFVFAVFQIRAKSVNRADGRNAQAHRFVSRDARNRRVDRVCKVRRARFRLDVLAERANAAAEQERRRLIAHEALNQMEILLQVEFVVSQDQLFES